MVQFAHFVKHSPTYIADSADPEISLGAFLADNSYPPEFGAELLYPMLSVVCTCSYAAVAAYPARIIIDYFANKYGLSGAQCRAYGGTRDVVARLTAPVARVTTSANIEVVQASKASCSLTWRDAKQNLHVEAFDAVVLAMQANASKKVLSTDTESQLSALGAFEYEKNRVVLHTDSSLMPPRWRDWSPLNIEVAEGADAASVTVWMNRIDRKLRRELVAPIFQTWNPLVEPAKASVIADFAFERPVVTKASVKAMAALQESQGRGHVWFVGAYSLNAMPLLENGVKSAMLVARQLGVNTSDVEFDENKHADEALTQQEGGTRRVLMYGFLIAVVGAAVLGASRVMYSS